MKRFTFRLDRILDLREKTEKQRARLLRDALLDEDARRCSLEEAESRLDRCAEQIVDAAGSGVTAAGTLQNLGLTIKAAASEVDAADASHQTAEEAVRAEQEKFAEACKDRRVVERLREKRHEEWSVETSRLEQRAIDAISHHRRAAGGKS
jgi:flagellar protein FliJ